MAGTTWDVVVLSSSPPAPAQYTFSSPPLHPLRRVAVPPSSPPLLSPSGSPKRVSVGAHEANLQADAVPKSAVRQFATMGNPVPPDRLTRPPDNEAAAGNPAQSLNDVSESLADALKSKRKSNKSSVRTVTGEGNDKPKTKPRGRRPKQEGAVPTRDPELRLPIPSKSSCAKLNTTEASTEPNDGSEEASRKLIKAGKPRKPRATKKKENDSARLTESKRRKPRVYKEDEILPGDSTIVSSYFQHNLQNVVADEQTYSHDAGGQENARKGAASGRAPRRKKKTPSNETLLEAPVQDLALEEAIVRRRGWTPPAKDTSTSTLPTEVVGKENVPTFGIANDTFTHLISNFALNQPHLAQEKATSTEVNGKVPAKTKRRRIELVEIPSNQNMSRESSPTKRKAPKKKARTITDIVMDQFVPKEPGPDSDSNLSLYNSALSSTTMKLSIDDTHALKADLVPKKPVKRRANTKSESQKLATKSKVQKAVSKSTNANHLAGNLLSPSSALGRLDSQNFLFGTSSQLALDESLVTVRELQLAIKMSEQEVEALSDSTLKSPLRWSKLGKVKGSKDHWAASARDEGGCTLDALEDANIFKTVEVQNFRPESDGINDDSGNQTVNLDSDEINSPSVILISSDLPTPPHSISRNSKLPVFEDDGKCSTRIPFKETSDYGQEPPPSNQLQRVYTDVGNLHSVALPRMTCGREPESISPSSWPGIVHKSMETGSEKLSMNESKRPQASSYMPLTPSKPSRRFINVEEIFDSEDERLEALSPTPPRIRKNGSSPPLQLVSTDPVMKSATTRAPDPSDKPTLTPVVRISVDKLQWQHVKEQVYVMISTYIRSLPPTSDPKMPSWHERILMYEPIVLEDFTTHLNAKTDIRTYKKATQKQIKSWNRMLKQDGQPTLSMEESEEEILAVKKELELYMVQSWCERFSICCIGRENRGKGGVRKGLY